MEGKALNKVLIRGLEVSARHGVHDFEKTDPQLFIFDADVYCDFSLAAVCDDLNGTVNYSAVCDLIANITRENTFNLIETLAYTCAYAVLDKFPAYKISLTVYKPQAPVKQKIQTVGVNAEVERTTAYLSLGSSEGDRAGYLNAAIAKLNEVRGVKVEDVSDFITTKPCGGVAKNEFLNCAVKIETYLSPQGLLREINRIEAECGRVRKKRWDDRTLDIDIIFFGDKTISCENLQIPHPEYAKRDFVLVPLKQIAPEFVCPLLHKKIKNI